MRTCKKCLQEKALTEFDKAGKTTSGEIAYRGQCKTCRSIHRPDKPSTPEERTAKYLKDKLWKEANKDSDIMHRRKSRWKSQGIDPVIAEKYFVEHQGKCDLCGESSTRTFHIDHCHTTGKIRGVLCSTCNSGLGMFKDSQRLLVAAIDYLNNRNQ
jgi:hypothetical protein